MKVILVNGSPHEHGCTYTALCEVADALEKNGISAPILHIGTRPIAGCMGCYQCRAAGKCVLDDRVNEIAAELSSANGMVFGSPVYFASPTGGMLSFLDRLYASAGDSLMYKPCGCAVSARRAGTTAALDALNKYPLVCEQPLVSSGYWCMVHGSTPQEVRQDEEGMRIMRTLGRNMAWLVKSLAAARDAGVGTPE
ncbi:MAG: flavodoxin family protein [Eubacteriales bacterium]|nr:flavodoxin family protein [Eubacteriales bacterium]